MKLKTFNLDNGFWAESFSSSGILKHKIHYTCGDGDV